jgi:hypothetical protein
LSRDNTQSIHVDVKPDPACTGVGFVSGANALDIDNKVTATGCPAPMNCSAAQTPPSWTFDSKSAVSGSINFRMIRGNQGGPNQKGSCTLTVNIRMDR